MRPSFEHPTAPVVLVEDDPAVRQLLGEVLALNGVKVASFASPFHALAAIRRERPSLLVLDWHLPEMSGRALLDHLREHLGPLPPVLVVTGDVQLGIPADVAEILRKPVSLAHFVERVQALVSSPSSARKRFA